MNTTFVGELLVHIERSCTASSGTIAGEALADVLRLLVSLEVAPGGPYACVPGGSVKDADVGLNLIIAMFLRGQGVTLPPLEAFLDEALEQPSLTSNVVGDESLTELARFYEGTCVVQKERVDESITPAEERMLRLVRESAKSHLSTCARELSHPALRVIDRTIRGNPDRQMSLMAWYVREALGSAGEGISDSRVAELGLANLYFWTAFIIFDDFWDEDEAAEPVLLPVANLLSRHYTDFFLQASPKETGFSEFFRDTMSALDGANAWEMTACRMKRDGEVIEIPETLPEYGEYRCKFYPAAGHVLGPVLMLVELGYGIDSPEVTGFVSYAEHYLIATQLNDDLHDWKEDLARGHISTTVAELLRVLSEKEQHRTRIHLVDDMEMLERVFWFDVLPSLCVSIRKHTDAARAALNTLHFLENTAPLERFILRNEQMAQEALLKQEESVAFLARMAA